MSMPLFKATLKANWFLFLVFLAILLMYMLIMISMFDPDDVDAIMQLYETLPRGMLEAFGFDVPATDLVSFIALYFYGFLVLLFPMIYCVILANRLVAALVDHGSMAFLLVTPNSRSKVIVTQALYLVVSITLLLALNAGAGLLFSEILFPGAMDIPAFLNLNLVSIALTLVIGAICFFFSCLFNEAKHSVALGGGLPVFFFVVKMLSNIGDNYIWLEYLTIYSLFDAHNLVTGEQPALPLFLIFIAIALVLYAAGTIIFSRRNLYL